MPHSFSVCEAGHGFPFGFVQSANVRGPGLGRSFPWLVLFARCQSVLFCFYLLQDFPPVLLWSFFSVASGQSWGGGEELEVLRSLRFLQLPFVFHFVYKGFVVIFKDMPLVPTQIKVPVLLTLIGFRIFSSAQDTLLHGRFKACISSASTLGCSAL